MTDNQIKVSKEYKIGQVIFIKDNENIKVVPAIVTEKLSVETMDGLKVTYKVTLGEKSCELKDNWIIFENIDDLREHMAEQITTIITNLIKKVETDTEILKKAIQNKVVKTEDKK